MAKQEYTAQYIKSINGTDPVVTDGRPHVAFIGRSNVGKSSLINSVLGRNLARSSSNPGKTTTIDLFLVNNTMYFVDLPGYGFARVSQKEQEHFSRLIAWYLFSSGARVSLFVLIIDVKAGITEYDRQSIALLSEHGIPFVIAVNKVDKVKNAERMRQLAAIEKYAGNLPVIAYSTKTNEGRGTLRSLVFG